MPNLHHGLLYLTPTETCKIKLPNGFNIDLTNILDSENKINLTEGVYRIERPKTNDLVLYITTYREPLINLQIIEQLGFHVLCVQYLESSGYITIQGTEILRSEINVEGLYTSSISDPRISELTNYIHKTECYFCNRKFFNNEHYELCSECFHSK